MNRYEAIKHASNIRNLLEPFGDYFSRYSNDNCHLTIDCKWMYDMDSKTLDWTFSLVERNLKQLCLANSLGWHPNRIHKDLRSSWARYLIALDAENRRVGYSMFRFDIINGYSVLFCYELQIEKEYQRIGLGRFLINAMEELAKYYNMEKLILMVLLNNKRALKFYRQMDFEIDESSPSIDRADYLYLKIDTNCF